MEITLESVFRLEPFKEITVKAEKGHKFIDDNIAFRILGITFSTARGIIFEKLRGSKLQPFLLPIVDPKILLSNHDLRRCRLLPFRTAYLSNLAGVNPFTIEHSHRDH